VPMPQEGGGRKRGGKKASSLVPSPSILRAALWTRTKKKGRRVRNINTYQLLYHFRERPKRKKGKQAPSIDVAKRPHPSHRKSPLEGKKEVERMRTFFHFNEGGGKKKNWRETKAEARVGGREKKRGGGFCRVRNRRSTEP